MGRVLVCCDDQLSALRISRELGSNHHTYAQTSSAIKKDELRDFDLMIIHSSWRIPNLSSFIINLVLQRSLPIIYLSSVISIGPFREIMEDPYFAFIDDQRIDSVLGLAMNMMLKSTKALQLSDQKSKKELQRADLRRLMDRCKAHLMASGLSEEEAHHRILKTAMDRQMSKYDACAAILKENSLESD